MILFCLPYAGGSEMAYNGWNKYLNPSIELMPVKLKGRGRRFFEEFYASIDEAVEDIFENIKDRIKNETFAIYGHSMGSVLAYELYYKIIKEGFNGPKHIFFSGNVAPKMMNAEEKIHTLPDELFMKRIIDLGGTPKEVLESRELLEIIVPILKNDFKILSQYEYIKKDEKISCDITVFNGLQDKYSEQQIEKWRDESSGLCRIYNFEGGHFFINSKTKEIIEIINDTLMK